MAQVWPDYIEHKPIRQTAVLGDISIMHHQWRFHYYQNDFEFILYIKKYCSRNLIVIFKNVLNWVFKYSKTNWLQIRQTMRIATLQKKNPEFKHVLLLHSHRKIIQSLLSNMHVVEEGANYVYHATWTDSRDNISYYLTIVTLWFVSAK